MASAERIKLIRCPGCSEQVIAPPPESIGVWQCPFCRRRYRRRLRSSSSSGTIPCIGLFSKHPGPPGGWPAEDDRGILDPRQWASFGLGLYAAALIVLMVVYHLAATALAAIWIFLRIPAILWKSLSSEEEREDDEPRPSPWSDLLRTWTPHFRRRDPDQGIGPILMAEDAPGIFVIVAEMSRKIGAAKPDEIRLTHLPCCGVLEQRKWAGLRSRRRVLVVGLPLLYVLSVEDFRAVLAHELAHLSRGDAALAFVVSQFIDSLEQSIAARAESRWGWFNPCVLFAWLIHGAFRVLSSPLSRHQEYRADAVAASVCGGDVVSNSLRTVALVQPIFKEVLCDYHPVVVYEANLYQFFRIAWEAVEESLKEEIKDSLVAEERAELFSPHPTLRARLMRLERHPKHREPDYRPARRLLNNRKKLETLLHDYIYCSRTPQLSVFHPAGE